jgi:hypothetical protein
VPSVEFRLWEQLFPSLCILDEDGADGAVLGGLEDFLDGVTGGIDSFRLTVLIEPKHVWGDRLAHGIPDAYVVVYSDAQLAGHWAASYCQVTGSDFSDRNVMLG